MDSFLTVDQAAELTGYNREYMRQLIRAGKLRARKFGPVWAIERDSLAEYLARRPQDGRWGAKAAS